MILYSQPLFDIFVSDQLTNNKFGAFLNSPLIGFINFEVCFFPLVSVLLAPRSNCLAYNSNTTLSPPLYIFYYFEKDRKIHYK